MRLRSLMALSFLFTLAACDAWPTTFDNDTTRQVSFRYLDKDLDYWSESLQVKPGYAVRLARGYWIADIRSLEVTDGIQIYSWTEKSIQQLASSCFGNDLPLREFWADDCTLIYSGNGRLIAMPTSSVNPRYQVVKASGQ